MIDVLKYYPSTIPIFSKIARSQYKTTLATQFMKETLRRLTENNTSPFIPIFSRSHKIPYSWRNWYVHPNKKFKKFVNSVLLEFLYYRFNFNLCCIVCMAAIDLCLKKIFYCLLFKPFCFKFLSHHAH